MAIVQRPATDDYNDVTLTKRNAKVITVQVYNQPVLYQLNAAPWGWGDLWVPDSGAPLGPGFWTFTADDFHEFNVPHVQGIRIRNAGPLPAVVSVS